ncbi:protein GAMETOPHYTE DEFECTIVE 1 [Mercurialis annua]|uniref:protein GAMETOPHYTE DEFECTIVE 1 n=1 Tax=Mercurialis annua TaxID=3986 RepID=UPI00216093F0|nr:protein GAMETOPHYTE DEFECTIVE 1 [Mercurialis annua]
MGFFDLNIPYETSQSSKTTRVKLVIKSMELGYTGIAYNRTIKGVMSDQDRCSITPLSLSTLLKVAPSLSSSVNFHRDLLRVPRASPFRQYTRLTVCVDCPAQYQVLNSGNMILKSYDLIAVRPLNQLAFDYVCEKAEVNIIAIDFSDKLPFRLKFPMVKAAIERGVYFEITYADLIVDVQLRRQMIPNAKLLVSWTRGRNLIISSAASSINELRGPYDVANLSSLLGLSMERAKAAISKNCRNLMANVLRKKHFYKETIRVEPIYGRSDSKEPSSLDWLKWDPVSSGEGDLQLEDIAKSFSATTGASNCVKAIDFVAVIDSIQSHGPNFLTAAKAVEVSIKETGASEELAECDLFPDTDCNFLDNIPSKNQTLGHGSSQELHLPSDSAATLSRPEDIRATTNTISEEPNNSNVSDAVLPFLSTQKHGLQLEDPICSNLNTVLADEDVLHQTPAAENGLTDSSFADSELKNLSENFDFLESQFKKSMHSYAVFDEQKAVVDKDIEDLPEKDQEDTPLTEHRSGRKQQKESRHVMITLVEDIPSELNSDEMDLNDVTAVAYQENLEDVVMEGQEHGDSDLDHPDEVAMDDQESGDAVTKISLVEDNDLRFKDDSASVKVMPKKEVSMEEQKLEGADIERNHRTFVPAISGRSKSKQRIPLMLPFKRLLNPIPMKRKSKRKVRT